MFQKKYFAQLLTEKCSYKHSLHKYWGQRGRCAPAGICKCTVCIQVLGHCADVCMGMETRRQSQVLFSDAAYLLLRQSLSLV